MKNRAILVVALAALVLTTGCLTTVQQKITHYAGIGEAAYKVVKGEYLDTWKPRYQAVKAVFVDSCALDRIPGGVCGNLADADEVFAKLDDAATRVHAEAKDIEAAKDKVIQILTEMETALQEAGVDPPPAP